MLNCAPVLVIVFHRRRFAAAAKLPVAASMGTHFSGAAEHNRARIEQTAPVQ